MKPRNSYPIAGTLYPDSRGPIAGPATAQTDQNAIAMGSLTNEN